VCAIPAAAFAAGSATTTSATTTIKIGSVDSLTGLVSFCGASELRGIQLAIKQANAGKVLGKNTTISLTSLDDGSSPTQGLAAYRTLVGQKPAAIIGSCLSSVDQAVAPLTNNDKIPVVFPQGGGPTLCVPQTNPYVYCGAVFQGTVGPRSVAILAKRGVKSISVIYASDNPTIALVWQIMKASLAAKKINVVDEFPVSSTTSDFSSFIAQIKKHNPGAVGLFLIGGQNISGVTQLRQAGITIPVLGAASMSVANFIPQSGAAANGSLFATTFDPRMKYPSSTAFASAFQTAYGVTADFPAASGYDSARMVIEALITKQKRKVSLTKALNITRKTKGAEGPLTRKNHSTYGPGVVIEVINQQATVAG
jgi:branched-chain amino acid transport system substrate-binding protein